MTHQTHEPFNRYLSELLDALLYIKRLAEKSGDAETDPFALLDLIADKACAAINSVTRG